MNAGKKLLGNLLIPLVGLLGMIALNGPIMPGSRPTRLNRSVTHCRYPTAAYDDTSDALASVERTRMDREPAPRSPLSLIATPLAIGNRSDLVPSSREVAAAIGRRQTHPRRLLHSVDSEEAPAIL